MRKYDWKIISIISAAVLFAAAEWFILPDKVAMQIGSGGELQNVVTKPVAIAIPFVITMAASLVYALSKDQKNKKALFAAIVGLALPVLTVIINLK